MTRILKLALIYTLITSFSATSYALKIDGANFEIDKLSENVYVIGQDFGTNKINFGIVIAEQDVYLITSMITKSAPAIENC